MNRNIDSTVNQIYQAIRDYRSQTAAEALKLDAAGPSS
jgi:hypothetical protein